MWNGLGSGELLGVGACLGAVGCYGIGFPYARRLTNRPEGPVALATGQVLCGALQLLPFAVLTGHVDAHVAAASWYGMAGLGALGSGVAYILNFHIVARAGGTIASTVTYVTPVFAVIVGAAFLSEPVTWYEPVGGLVILAGAALAQERLPAPREKAATPGRQLTYHTNRCLSGAEPAGDVVAGRRAPCARLRQADSPLGEHRRP